MDKRLLSLYDLAEKENIEIDRLAFERESAMTLRTDDGRYHIAIDPCKLQNGGDELVKLSHELGHCQTGSLYSRQNSQELRGRCELRANKWAVHRLIPFESYQKALRSGCTEFWQLAEYFGLPEDFIRMADRIYRQEKNDLHKERGMQHEA